MNKTRRAQVSEAMTHIENAKGILESVRDCESDAMENLPESLQESEMYERMEEAVEAVESAMDYLDMAFEELDTVVT